MMCLMSEVLYRLCICQVTYCICCLSVPLEMSPARMPLVSRDHKPGYSHKPPTVDLWGALSSCFHNLTIWSSVKGIKNATCLAARPQHTGRDPSTPGPPSPLGWYHLLVLSWSRPPCSCLSHLPLSVAAISLLHPLNARSPGPLPQPS